MRRGHFPKAGMGLAPKPVTFPQNGVLGALWDTAPIPGQRAGFGVPLQESLLPPCPRLQPFVHSLLCSPDSVSSYSMPGPVLGDQDEQETTDWWEMDRWTDRQGADQVLGHLPQPSAHTLGSHCTSFMERLTVPAT